MLDSSPLAQYSAEHWIGHTKLGGMELCSLLRLIMQIFMSETAVFMKLGLGYTILMIIS